MQRWKAPQAMAAGATVAICAGAISDSENCKSTNRQWKNQSTEAWNARTSSFLSLLQPSIVITCCEAAVKEEPVAGGYSHLSEEEATFLNTMAVYRRWLNDIKKQWAISSPPNEKFPSNIPNAKDISALEMDLQMYQKGDQGNSRLCQDLEFRIASYYIFRAESLEEQRKGFNIVKKLAVAGHPDGICLYGTSNGLAWNLSRKFGKY